MESIQPSKLFNKRDIQLVLVMQHVVHHSLQHSIDTPLRPKQMIPSSRDTGKEGLRVAPSPGIHPAGGGGGGVPKVLDPDTTTTTITAAAAATATK